MISSRLRFSIILSLFAWLTLSAAAQEKLQKIEINWDKTVIVSKSTPTLQVVTNPMLNPGSPIHDGSFSALKALGADYVRYVPWLPYPKIAVAELEPPTKDKTSWDFKYIDPVTKDFLAATQGHSTVMNFSTIPAWMFKTDQPVKYPEDPNQVDWHYTQGTVLRDPTGKELGDYFGRLVSWYTQGGFTDENGKRHESGYHYNFPIWEVLNEIDFEHNTTPEDYNKRYDAIVEGIRKVSPKTQFMGLALAMPGLNPKYFEYFLNPKNHKPGIPLDYVSFHFYASPARNENLDTWQLTFFDQARGFLATTRYILAIRDRLSPHTKIDTDELGVILPTDNTPADKTPPPARYWNAAGALYAFLFVELSKMGVDVIGESQLVGYPTQFPSVSMMDYNNGKPNARYWVLKLIKDNFHPGDKLVEEKEKAEGDSSPSDVTAQGFLTPQGKKVLLVNRANSDKVVTLAQDLQNASTLTVDQETGDEAPRAGKPEGANVRMAPFAVTVLSVQ